MTKVSVRKFIGKGVPFALTVQTEEGETQLSFRLLFDFNALALVEETTGYSLLTGAIFKHLNASISSVLFWAAVQAHSPEYAGPDGLEAIRSMLNLRNYDLAQQAVQEAFIQSLPEAQAALIREALKPKEGDVPLAETTVAPATT